MLHNYAKMVVISSMYITYRLSFKDSTVWSLETFIIIINSIESEHRFALNYSIIFNDIYLCNRPFDPWAQTIALSNGNEIMD